MFHLIKKKVPYGFSAVSSVSICTLSDHIIIFSLKLQHLAFIQDSESLKQTITLPGVNKQT